MLALIVAHIWLKSARAMLHGNSNRDVDTIFVHTANSE